MTAYAAIIMLTILPQLIGHGVYNYALRQLPATFVSVVGQLGIIISAVLAYLFFREIPSILEIPGSIAIIAGITLVNLKRPPIIVKTIPVAVEAETEPPVLIPIGAINDRDRLQLLVENE